ncbi:tRNA (guanosine(37)-N1)-methyltransferase TrmD [Patescibacteria group bacterium]|nr:MAG: tRNA (guanosine(37)-N1)-methyltransferase TrmD [Patescibacteria group bacterium]
MKFDVLTIFPEIINDYCSRSILGRAQKAGAISVRARNFRDHTLDKHGHVDDSPYGGGAGMVLQVQPIFDCLKAIGALSLRGLKGRSKPMGLPRRSAPRNDTRIIVLDPAGKKFDQRMAEKFSKLDRLILICGRYEGFDERVYKLADEKISVGDYVLAGGELAALAVVEATARLTPGVLGNKDSLKEETFVKGVIEYPQYTRPEDFNGWKVPKILLSGAHKKIAEWRKRHSS